MDTKGAYKEAISKADYGEKTSGLAGKYDNVRLLWEDEITRLFLVPYLKKLVQRKRAEKRKLRFLDLGCGCGDGYDLLTRLSGKAKLSDHDPRLVPSELLGYYKGVDLNEELLKRGETLYEDDKVVNFSCGDFCQGLPVDEKEQFYDLYFTSYGTLSHCNDKELENLLIEIAKHARNGSIIVGDWLGRFSYEWQSLWTYNYEEVKIIDYIVSYLPRENSEPSEVPSFPLRLMSREEVQKTVSRAADKVGVGLNIKKLFDRSMLVGRHMETGDYNPYVYPLRRMVNSLHEPGVRTYLPDLIFEYRHLPGFTQQNKFMEELITAWNNLIQYTQELLDYYDNPGSKPPSFPEGKTPVLQRAYSLMRRAVENEKNLFGDARADFIESQLGFALRNLEINIQRGIGMGHGLVAVIEVEK